MTYTDPVTSSASGAAFYVDGFGTAYMIGQGNDIPFGLLQPQAVNPSIAGGDYVFGPDGLLGTTLLPITTVAIDTTALTFTSLGGGSAGPYVLDPVSGRGTITLNTAATFGDCVFHSKWTVIPDHRGQRWRVGGDRRRFF